MLAQEVPARDGDVIVAVLEAVGGGVGPRVQAEAPHQEAPVDAVGDGQDRETGEEHGGDGHGRLSA